MMKSIINTKYPMWVPAFGAILLLVLFGFRHAIRPPMTWLKSDLFETVQQRLVEGLEVLPARGVEGGGNERGGGGGGHGRVTFLAFRV